MMAMYQAQRNLVMELNELLIIYNYTSQNAPSAENKKLIKLNIKTAINTKTTLEKIHNKMFGKDFTDLKEAPEKTTEAADFLTTSRDAFIKETQVIQLLKNIYLRTDSYHHNDHFNDLVEHKINAMRILYLLT